MPRNVPLEPIPDVEIARRRLLPQMKELTTRYPKRAASDKAAARASLRKWLDSQTTDEGAANEDIPIVATPLTSAQLTALRTIGESDVAPATMLEEKVDPATLAGTLYTAFAARGFMEMESEYRRRKAAGRASANVEKQWQEVVRAGQAALAAAGMRDVDEDGMRTMLRELRAKPKDRDFVVGLLGQRGTKATSAALTGRTRAVATIVPAIDVVREPSELVTVIKDLCDAPFKQGSYTKHFAHSVDLKIRITYWCPTWADPWRTCTATIKIATVSFSLDVNVGYKLTCCGATAWGQGYAEACATFLGKKYCASCKASITGVAGLSRTPIATGCSYGLGVTASLKCELAGYTLLNLTYSFGWVVNGPCPPVPCP